MHHHHHHHHHHLEVLFQGPSPDTTSLNIADDVRMDPRLKAMLAAFPMMEQQTFQTREEQVANANTPEATAAREQLKMMMDMMDSEEFAPSDNLDISTREFTSSPDGNAIKIQFIRPKGKQKVPCVYYIHGGGMMIMSAFYGNYRAWGKMIANNGVAVAMVDFRNCLSPSSAPEVAPFPAGLNDCVSGLKWVSENADELSIDKNKIIIAGEAGGGNLTLATGLKLKQDGNIDLVKGLYALCPYIAGKWPQDRFPSSSENNGIMIELHNNQGALAYGIEQLEAENPLAWPSFASAEDMQGLPPTVINVNECDPLRDEGIDFYRRLMAAGVPARCRQVMGTCHAGDMFVAVIPDVSADTAADIARTAKGGA
uniref:Esterase n=1 Tax=uncultured bacterium TaxID=77133 RepID=UPI001AD9514C|nr:Chain A, Esterase [uncultured bacterium]6SXY_B Chain B, Esterase [uncultured bacterium]6SYA_A Chain A, Esterase [uncultured bacterium]6SYA_B Chain B, Esterase [uncultured bacterium]